MVLIKNVLKDHVVVLDNEFDNTVTVKFRNLTDDNNDVILISTYVPPYSSPYYDTQPTRNGIRTLEQCIYNMQLSNPNSSFIVCGDLNSRISDIQPVLESEIADQFIDGRNTLPLFEDDTTSPFKRVSEDSEVNGFGKTLIEICAEFGLIVLNGMLDGDSRGYFTYLSPNGSSVIDYFIVSECLVNNNIDMHVLSGVDSWHMPINLVIKRCAFKNDSQPKCNHNKKIEKIVWDADRIEEFVATVDTDESKQKIKEIAEKVPTDINSAVQDLSNLLTSAASNMKRSFPTQASGTRMGATWYDKECHQVRKSVRKSLRKYRKVRTELNKAEYIQSKKLYRNLLRAKRQSYSEKKISFLLSNLGNSSKFWKEIKTTNRIKGVHSNSIDISDWYKYFRSIFQVQRPIPPICLESVESRYIREDMCDIILNADITTDEIKASIERAITSKSPGPDNVLNGMLKSAAHVIIPLLSIIFQQILDSGVFPEDWCKSNIIPVHKKGDVDSCNNYRPISLTSLTSKMFTNILNKRLTMFTESLGIVPEEQAGFREDYSTVDHIFSLHAMIKKQFTKNMKLYVAFIDYKKCFDSIDRNALFHVLEANGIQGKMLTVIKGLYSSVLAAVKNNGELSDYFECPIGVKQGCILSPTIFTVFMTEITRILNIQGKHGIQLLTDTPSIHHLLYADDIVLLSDTVIGLQSKLDLLYLQSERLGLEVNPDKTKIVVFRKGGHLSKYESWTYNGNPVEIVNSYSYLGMEFSTRLSFTSSIIPFVAKAKKACFEILRSLRSFSCNNLSVFVKLFDAKVQPILSYGSELWGIQEISDVEVVHTSALKQFLNVSLHCANVTVYGDTGRFPLHINHKTKSIKYWLRLLKLPQSRICKQAYMMMLKLSEKGEKNWVTSIRDMLIINGFGIVWMFKEVGCEISFLRMLKERLQDCYRQGWNSKINSSEHFTFYHSFKSLIETERFLIDNSLIKPYRDALIKFRLGVSQIRSHRYKFCKSVSLMYCPFCPNVKEDEMHILFACPLYVDIRKECIPQKYLSNCNRYVISILLSNHKYTLTVAKFLYIAFKKRKLMLETESM